MRAIRLVALGVENVGILRDVQLSLGDGLTVLSGESGAGKSLLIRAIQAAIGGRVDAERVGPFGDRARVTLEFFVDPSASLWEVLTGFGIDPDETLVLTREWGREGRGTLRVQGRPVPQSVVRPLFQEAMDLVGQHEHQRLLRRDYARRWLDGLIGDELTGPVTEAYQRVAAADRERESLEAAVGRREILPELREQVAELEALELHHDTEANLRQEAERIQNAERLLGFFREASELLDGGGLGAVSRATRLLADASHHDPGAAKVAEDAAAAESILEDVRRDLYRLAETVEFDDRRLEAIRDRLDRMARLARRYGTDPQGLLEVLEARRAELSRLEESAFRLSAIGREREAAWAEFKRAAARLSTARRQRAAEVSRTVSAVLEELDMPGAALQVQVEAVEPSVHGEDGIRFSFRSAPAAPWKPLEEVASGGEMARVTLALTVAETEGGLMVFDEVDAGLGGQAARRVADLLERLSAKGTMVLAVTHQAVVAAVADHHLRAQKHLVKGRLRARRFGLNGVKGPDGVDSDDGFLTEARVEKVSGRERERELARMLSGSSDEAALLHARRLLEGGSA